MDLKKPVLNIVVVGFHHKKGCQVEFSYPPLVPGTEGKNECPSGWKYLPTLALPDGSHNFNSDTVCFNLPSLTEPQQSVYGISCYRQIAIEDVKNRTADLTRSTVQKSVCALLSLPIYGYVEVKLSLIARAYFEQGDFATTELLEKAYEQLNACLEPQDTIGPSRLLFVGMPLRDLLLKWKHKMLILFKLQLLQKRVLYFGSPVQPTCSLILSLVSLHPELIAKGFQQVACVKTTVEQPPFTALPTGQLSPTHQEYNAQEASCSVPKETVSGNHQEQPGVGEPTSTQTKSELADYPTTAVMGGSDPENLFNSEDRSSLSGSSSSSFAEGDQEESRPKKRRSSAELVRDASMYTIAPNFESLYAIEPGSWGAPLRIFDDGHLCLPYLSLPYLDLLTDPAVHSYTIGTSNVLFQHKRQLANVLVDVEGGIIEMLDLETKRQLHLTTEDLRFIDYVVRNAQTPREDAEGSECWIRNQLYGYTVALLKTSLEGGTRQDNFNAHFMTAFKATHCYKDWLNRTGEGNIPAFDELLGGHPFAGSLSVADMKLKIAQTMQNSDGGRKLNQAVTSTSRVVGTAITTAKGAFSSWWNTLTTPVPAQSPSISPQQEVTEWKVEPQSPEVGQHDEATGAASIEHGVRQQQNAAVTNAVIEIGKEAELLNRIQLVTMEDAQLS
ncbi:late secretory pathway protein AVL9 homolog [Anopheles darlingi]|uniref:late secretory pathway protein AVL9 homolog n=1 Tax=Anopheles darlingi TaxID=43151 RepID=UPI0020FFFB31|nr:late secretory pathway protein AVL9 homolog [Anopheles darlingi]